MLDFLLWFLPGLGDGDAVGGGIVVGGTIGHVHWTLVPSVDIRIALTPEG